MGPYDHTKRAPAKGSTLGYWQAEEGLKAADYMQQNPSQHQLPPIEGRNHPGRHVEGAPDDSRDTGSLQENSATDSGHVIEEEEEDEDVADVEGHSSGAREAAGVPALQLAERSHLVSLLCFSMRTLLGSISRCVNMLMDPSRVACDCICRALCQL